MLTPLAVGPGRPFPYISNLSLSLAVWLRDPVTRSETFARVKVPKEVLPRFVADRRVTRSSPLEHVIARHLGELFPGMEIVRHGIFRVTRDADFTVSDEADDLLRAVEDELRRRRFGEVVRLEVGADMEPELREQLVELARRRGDGRSTTSTGLLDMGDLWEIARASTAIASCATRPGRPVHAPGVRRTRSDGELDMFAAMRAGDVLVHHPYDSFAASVERFVAAGRRRTRTCSRSRSPCTGPRTTRRSCRR